MFFLDFLQSIQHDAPKKIYVLTTNSAVLETPISLSTDEIQQLIDFAVQHHPFIEFQSKKIPMLTFLMSLGTQISRDQQDLILGFKDPRFEELIIQTAEQKIAYTNADVPFSAVFGLSANPPTMGHLMFIQHLLTQYADVHVVLNGQSPLKKKEEYAPADLRLEMLSDMLSASDLPLKQCLIERVEIDREYPSRMIATLSLLTLSSAISKRWVLVLGIDVLFHFLEWYQWDRIGHLCELKFYPRPGVVIDVDNMLTSLQKMTEQGMSITLVYDTVSLKEKYRSICSQLNKPVTLVHEPFCFLESASCELRQYYKSATPQDTPPATIHASVDQKIRKLKLYGFDE